MNTKFSVIFDFMLFYHTSRVACIDNNQKIFIYMRVASLLPNFDNLLIKKLLVTFVSFYKKKSFLIEIHTSMSTHYQDSTGKICLEIVKPFF
jgi:hypothetical protein